MKKIGISFLLSIIFLLTGCSSPRILPTKTAISIPPTSTNTIVPPSPIALSTNTSTPLAEQAFHKNSCEPIHANLPPNIDINGTIILKNETGTFLLNIQSGDQQELDTTEQGYSGFSVSPDGKHLAYIQYSHESDSNRWLVITGINGQQEAKVSAKREWTSNSWLDNEKLIVSSPVLNDNDPKNPVVIFNPFTHQEQKLPSNYPGPELPYSHGPTTFAYGTRIIYDPSLKLAIYHPFDEKLNKFFIALWNQETKKMLAKIDGGIDTSTRNPIWSPNKEVFYFKTYSAKSPDGRELGDWFSVSADGDVQQLTHLSNFLNHAWIGNGSLSPNNRYLTFWLNTESSNQQDGSHENLAVLDLETLELSAYCVPESQPYDDYLPIWSPDSQYVAITQTIDDSNYPVIVLSIQDGWLAKVAENAFPEAWWAGENMLPVLAKDH